MKVCFLNGFASTYKHLYDRADKKSVWKCTDPMCYVKIVTFQQKIKNYSSESVWKSVKNEVIKFQEEAIAQQIGKHNHKTKVQKRQVKRTLLQDMHEKSIHTMTVRQRLKKIKKNINIEKEKMDIKRKLRQSLLRSLFLDRLVKEEYF